MLIKLISLKYDSRRIIKKTRHNNTIIKTYILTHQFSGVTMRLKKLHLKNIRSYVDEVIEFKESSTLLLGDIGSGKSTVLMALEFALFGIIKDDISASAILRHGESEGSVELSFEVKNKEYVIKRFLKKSGTGISQKAGFIICDGVKTDATPVELKSKVLQIIGYPESLVNKSKSLIFRYTVYTPQEQMKHIIFAGSEERLGILRKLFDIDKYKQIRENASFYSKELRQLSKYLDGQTDDLQKIIKESEEKNEELKNAQKQHDLDVIKKNEASEILGDIKTVFEGLEKEIKDFNQLKKEYSVNEAKIGFNKRQITSLKADIEKLEKEISLQKKDFEDKRILSAEKIEAQIAVFKKQQSEINNEMLKTNSKLSELNTYMALSRKNTSQITSLKNCPTCLQDVKPEYKNGIIEKSETDIRNFEKQIMEHKALLEKQKEILKANDDKIEQYQKHLQIANSQLLQKKMLDDKQKRAVTLNDNLQKTESDTQKLSEQKNGFEKLIEAKKNLEQNHIEKKLAVQKQEYVLKDFEIRIAQSKTKIDLLKKYCDSLAIRINEKKEAERKNAKIKILSSWLDEHFDSMMLVIEKNVMGRIYFEFNKLVSNWFDILVGDDLMELRLDDSFTPQIVQNGYETNIENLSGGEKTAVALAYRLALNRVINDVTSNINTDDLIILDEPTDGFSNEQLERMRDVLKELDVKQMIIVSHEMKMQDYADHIIRVTKNNHESRVSY